MACIKCGRKTKEQQVFCDDCLAQAESYPVDPATAIQLPAREATLLPKKKNGKKRADLPPEEQLPRLRSSFRWLLLALIVMLISFCLTAAMLLYLLDQRDNTPADRQSPVATAQVQQ